MAKRKRYSRPDYRLTEDIDVILGVIAILGLGAFITAQALHLHSIPNL